MKELNKTRVQPVAGADEPAPELPDVLPPVLQHLTKNVPSIYRAAVCEGVWPALGAYLHGMTVRYIDQRVVEPALMNLLIAPQSAGKSSLKLPVDYIMKRIKARDEANRIREAEYKLANTGKDAKQKDPRPTDIVIQYLGNDLTNAAFSMRVCDAARNGGRVLYSIFDEVECMKTVTSSKNSIDNVTKIIRTAFDRAMHGQERATADGFTGQAPLRWNFNVSTTPSSAKRFFHNGAVDGTLSRLNVSTIIMPGKAYDTEIPIFGKYDDAYEAALEPYIDKLERLTGTIECDEAEVLIRDVLREVNDAARDYESESYALLGRRSCVVAYYKAVILYALNDYQWTDDIVNYIRWSVKMDLWCKMLYFGERVENDCKQQQVVVVRNPRRILEQLPNVFSEQDYLEVLKLNGLSTGRTSTLRSWVSRGKVVLDSASGEYHKITPSAGASGGRGMAYAETADRNCVRMVPDYDVAAG